MTGVAQKEITLMINIKESMTIRTAVEKACS